jgi:RNA polymerase sigma-70 factor (ECF subfamily)
VQAPLFNSFNLTQQDYKRCFDQLFDPLRNYLYYKCGDGDLATDIVQDVFLKVWEKPIDVNQNTIKSLLYKMVNDAFFDYLRKNKVADKYLQRLQLDFSANTPDEILEYEELKQQYETILAALGEKQRSVFLMSRIENLTYKEIAERLSVSVKAVEKRMSQALKVLKEKLGK